jgi:SAM-dependent methyltransferase
MLSGIMGGVLTAPKSDLAATDSDDPSPVLTARPAVAEARAANLACYAEAGVTASYIDTPYHAVRRRSAVQLLQSALDAGTLPDGPIVEIGTGIRPMLDDLRTDRLLASSDLSLRVLEAQHPGQRRLCFDATAPLPFRTGTVAAIVIGELIEHVFYPGAMMREVARVLAPGGMVVVTTPNLATLHDRLRFLFGSTPRQVDALHPYLHLHIRPFTAGQLKRLLADNELETQATRSNFVGVRLTRGRWLQSRLLARLFPRLGGSLVMSARRRVTIG